MNRPAIALIAALAFSGTALAVEPVGALSTQEGTVLVNQGEEFVTASDAQVLNPGDRVMVMEGGSATVTFADGCVLPLEAGSLIVVPAQSTCAGAVATTEKVGPSYAQAVGDDVDDQSDGEKLAKAAIIGGTLLAMALILHDDEDDDDDEEPVSP